ncbi:unnamed protein product, partial [Laminaria digitata]
KSNIRKSLEDIESDLVRSAPAQPSGLQGAASYVNHAARSAVTFAIDGFNGASKVFDASFEALAEPSRRTLLKSSELFPWQSWYEAWTNITKGEDNLFATAGQKLITPTAVDGRGGGRRKKAPPQSGSSHEGVAGLGYLAGDGPCDGFSNVGTAGDGGGDGDGGIDSGGVGSGTAARAESPARAERRGAKRWKPEAKRRNRQEGGDGDALEGERGGSGSGSGGGGGGGEVAGSREFRRKRWKG